VQTHIPNLAWIVAAYLLTLSIASVYLVCRLWPPSEQIKEEEGPVRIIIRPVSVKRETHILLIVLTMGLVGGCAYDLWTLADNVVQLGSAKPSDRAFKEVQAIWYILRPWTSCLISLIFYGFIRSGLFVANLGSGKDINVYGMAGLAGAAGFWAGETYDKLAALLK
jgi:hypothetical protein